MRHHKRRHAHRHDYAAALGTMNRLIAMGLDERVWRSLLLTPAALPRLYVLGRRVR